jgi:hypothetical protein
MASASFKVVRPSSFAQAVELITPLPLPLLAIAVTAVPAWEAAVAVLLAVRKTSALGAVLALGTLVVFTVILLLSGSLNRSCSCNWEVAGISTSGIRIVFRNAGLAGLAVVGLLGMKWPGDAAWRSHCPSPSVRQREI